MTVLVEQLGVFSWRDRLGIVTARGFRNMLGGSPRIAAEIGCESPEAACHVLFGPEYEAVLRR